jgi:hypothetical protein
VTEVRQIKPAIPVRLDIGLYEGDSWSLGVSVTFPDLSGYGYPVSDLTDCVVKGQVKPGYNQPETATMKVDYIDRTARRVKIYLDPDDTIGDHSGRWDLQIVHTPSEFQRTWFTGEVVMERQSAT